MTTKVKIIGAGVAGLTCGVVLQEAGYQVDIVYRDAPSRTTSAVAAAVWFPYHIVPRDKAIGWSVRSLAVFQKLAHVSASGVRLDKVVLSGSEALLAACHAMAIPFATTADGWQVVFACGGYVCVSRLPGEALFASRGTHAAGRDCQLGGGGPRR